MRALLSIELNKYYLKVTNLSTIMKLSVHTLKETLFKGEAQKLIVRTPSGEITILDGHLPLISTVVGPSVSIVDNKNQKTAVKLSSGILEVRPESEVVVLANS
jgi:F0F1-type ATP synthase epsilon subunit